MVNTLISAVHLAGALWKQLRMYKVSFRCNCLCDRQGLAVLDFTGVFWPRVYGQSCYAIKCIVGWLGSTTFRM